MELTKTETTTIQYSLTFSELKDAVTNYILSKDGVLLEKTLIIIPVVEFELKDSEVVIFVETKKTENS